MLSPFMMLPVLLLMSYIDMTNPDTIQILRIAFGASVVLSLGYLQFLKSKIYSAEFDPKPTIKVEEPGKPVQMMNAQQYDLHEVQKMQTQMMIGLCIVLFMHYKWEYVQPLFIQAVTGPLNLGMHNLTMIHLLGKPATGDRARPFKEGGFADMMKQFAPSEEPAKPVAVKEEKRTGKAARGNNRSRKID